MRFLFYVSPILAYNVTTNCRDWNIGLSCFKRCNEVMMNCKFDCETDEECEYQCSTGLVVQMIFNCDAWNFDSITIKAIIPRQNFDKLRKSFQQVSGRMPLLPFMSRHNSFRFQKNQYFQVKNLTGLGGWRGQTACLEMKIKTILNLFQPFNFLCVVYNHDTDLDCQVTVVWWLANQA